MATGLYSFAAGRRAHALHDGAFVWADAQDADFSSTTDNQFAVRASNGVWFAQDAGSGKIVDVGERYRDNSIIAWARVSTSGLLATNDDYGVERVTNMSAGVYGVYITASTTLSNPGQHLVPMAIAEIDGPPTNPSLMRVVSINQWPSSNSYFEVYICDGVGAMTNNDFLFMATVR